MATSGTNFSLLSKCAVDSESARGSPRLLRFSTIMDSIFDDSDVSLTKNAFKMSDILSNDGMTFEVNFDDIAQEENDEYNYTSEELMSMVNLDCLGITDEDNYDDSQPFESLESKMTNVTDDGKLKKRVLREGYGEVVPNKSVVYIDYNAYLEYNEEPFDSTYRRKKQHIFRLDDGRVIPGLDIGVQTMKVNEKAQFLIHPDYAYKSAGCLNRVPKDSMVLFEVELHKFVNSGALVEYENLSEKEQNKFRETYKYALALREKGNDLFRTHKNYKAAIREYNTAVCQLENCMLADYSEQEEQQQLLLLLHTNLAVCYQKVDNARKCCIHCNTIYGMCKGTSLTVPAKVYFNNAKALLSLNDLKRAEQVLRQAARMERDNPEIVRCFIELNKLKEAKKERDLILARSLINPSGVKQKVHENFKESIRSMCKELKESSKLEFDISAKLEEGERKFVDEEAERFGLRTSIEVRDDVERLVVAKPME